MTKQVLDLISAYSFRKPLTIEFYIDFTRSWKILFVNSQAENYNGGSITCLRTTCVSKACMCACVYLPKILGKFILLKKVQIREIAAYLC